MILWEKLPKLEKELADLKKDMDRLCQNDSVSRAEISILIKRLDANDKHIKELYTIEAYRKAMAEVGTETGWSFMFNCTISGNAETETERNEFVKMLSDIDNKYNTK